MKKQSKIDDLFKKLSSIKLTTLQIQTAKNQVAQSLQALRKHHSELIQNIQQKIKDLQDKFIVVSKYCLQQYNQQKKQISQSQNSITKNKNKIKQIFNMVHNDMTQKIKQQQKILKNKKNSIQFIYNQVKDQLNCILNIVYQLQEKVMKNKMNIATATKNIVKTENKNLDQIIKQQQKQLQFIAQVQKKLIFQCDSLQKQIDNAVEGHKKKMQNRRIKIYSKLQLLLKEININ